MCLNRPINTDVSYIRPLVPSIESSYRQNYVEMKRSGRFYTGSTLIYTNVMIATALRGCGITIVLILFCRSSDKGMIGFLPCQECIVVDEI